MHNMSFLVIQIGVKMKGETRMNRINKTLFLDTYVHMIYRYIWIDFPIAFYGPFSVFFFIPYQKKNGEFLNQENLIPSRTAPHETKKNKITLFLSCEVVNRACAKQPTNFISLKMGFFIFNQLNYVFSIN